MARKMVNGLRLLKEINRCIDPIPELKGIKVVSRPRLLAVPTPDGCNWDMEHTMSSGGLALSDEHWSWVASEVAVVVAKIAREFNLDPGAPDEYGIHTLAMGNEIGEASFMCYWYNDDESEFIRQEGDTAESLKAKIEADGRGEGDPYFDGYQELLGRRLG